MTNLQLLDKRNLAEPGVTAEIEATLAHWKAEWHPLERRWGYDMTLFIMQYTASWSYQPSHGAVLLLLRRHPTLVRAYLELAKANPDMAIPDWWPPMGNPVFEMELKCVSTEYIPLWLELAPLRVWNFRNHDLARLEPAAHYGALFELIKQQAPAQHVKFLREKYAKKLFALMIAVSDSYRCAPSATPISLAELTTPLSTPVPQIARFFAITSALPMELQSLLAGIWAGAVCPQTLRRKRLRWALE